MKTPYIFRYHISYFLPPLLQEMKEQKKLFYVSVFNFVIERMIVWVHGLVIVYRNVKTPWPYVFFPASRLLLLGYKANLLQRRGGSRNPEGGSRNSLRQY